MGIADAVYSSDTDPVAFGAKKLLRKNPKDKKIYEYTQDNILEQIQNINSDHYPDIYDIRKISVILGTDVCDKTAGIGSKTVIKKYRNIKLTKKQEQAIKFFEKHPNGPLIINNEDKKPFIDINLDELLLWLVNIKKFKEHIWKPRFLKAMNINNDNKLNIDPVKSSNKTKKEKKYVNKSMPGKTILRKINT